MSETKKTGPAFNPESAEAVKALLAAKNKCSSGRLEDIRAYQEAYDRFSVAGVTCVDGLYIAKTGKPLPGQVVSDKKVEDEPSRAPINKPSNQAGKTQG